ncbi:MAG: PAS domain S-box protein [Bacteroidales bacterium]
MENLPLGIQVFDREGFSYEMNPARKKLPGLPNMEEGIGQFNVFTDPYSKTMGADKFYEKVYKGETYDREFEYDLGAKENKWKTKEDKKIFHETIFPIKDKKGKVKYAVAVLQDKTEERNTEKTLKEKKDLLERVFDSIIDMTALTDLEGNFTLVGKSQEILGYDSDYLIGKNVMDFVHPEDVAFVSKELSYFLKSGKDRRVEFRYKRIDGKYLWFETIGTILRDKKGNPIQILFSTRNITARKKAEFKLQKKNEELEKQKADLTQYKRMVEGSKDIMAIVDSDYKYLCVNSAFLKYHQLSEEEVLGSTAGEILGEQFFKEKIQPYLEKCFNGKNVQQDIIGQSPEFGQVYLDINYYPLESDEGIDRIVAVMRDITQYKQEEKEKLKYFKEFEITLKGLGCNQVFRYRKNKNDRYVVTFSEGEIAESFGFTTNQVKGKTLAEVIGEDEADKLKPYFFRAFEGETVEYDFQSGDRWFYTKLLPFETLSDGSVVEIIGTSTEITQRKKMELSLEESERKYRQLFENAPVGISQTDLQGQPIMQNDTMAHLLGFENSEEMMKYYYEHGEKFYVDPQRRQEFLQKIKDQGYVKNFEYKMRRKDGSLIWLSVTANKLNNQSDNGVTIESFAIDITDQKEAEFELQKKYEELETIEEELRTSYEELQNVNDRLEQQKAELKKAKEKIEKSEERYQNFLAHSSEGIYRFELKNPVDIDLEVEAQIDLIYEDSYLAECNNKFVEMYGASSVQDVLGLSLADLHGGKDNSKNRKEIKDFIEQDYRITNRVTVEATRTGETVYFSNNTIGILENKKLIRMWGVQADVTQQKIMEQNLIASKEKAEESDRLKSAFLANMSHEIRTPMNGIMGFSQMLQEKEFPRDRQKKFLNIIHSRTQHLLHIINDLVDVSKIEANQLTLNFQHLNLNDMMQELYTTYKNQLEKEEKTQIQLKKDLGLNYQGSYIESDFQRLRQIMDNLLNNAIKFTDEGTIEFGYNLSDEGTLVFFVKDTGIGIPSDKKDYVFERFRQLDDSSNRAYEGTGLGLTISKSLVELLGGEMWVDSKEGEGSVFYFTLPYKTQNTAKKEETEKNEAEYNWQDKTVLVVEDDPTTLEYLKEVIEPMGVELILKQTGEEGYQAFKDNADIDLILMDIRLPDISGTEIIKRIRETNNEVKIIAQTAHAMGEDRKLCLQAGADDYIAKPIEINHLLKIISKYV